MYCINNLAELSIDEIKLILENLLNKCINKKERSKTLHLIGVGFWGQQLDSDLLHKIHRAMAKSDWAIINSARNSVLHSLLDIIIVQSAIEYAAYEYFERSGYTLRLKENHSKVRDKSDMVSSKYYVKAFKDAFESLMIDRWDMEWLCPKCCKYF